MFLNPVFQGQFILSQFRKDLRFLVAFAQFFFHLADDGRDPLIAVMSVEGFKQIQFGVLLNFHTQVIKLPDRRVAGQKI